MSWDFPTGRTLYSAKQRAKSYAYSHPKLRFCWTTLSQIRFQIHCSVAERHEWVFDAWTGIESRGEQELDGLTLKGPHGPEATAYGPVDAEGLLRGLSSLGINFGEYIFVDLGAGKGRGVLLASRYPFKKIIGVEFAKELYDTALENAKSWRPKRKCGLIEFVWADILDFEIPPDPCVIYCYHAFSEFVLSQLLEKVLRAIETFQRDIVILYVNPVHERVIQSLPNVQMISKSLRFGYSAYRIRSPSSA